MSDSARSLVDQHTENIGDSNQRESGFGYPRYFHGGRRVYTVISPRAKGLTIGVNLNPDRYCDFDCVYCEVHGAKPKSPTPCDVESASKELDRLLSLAFTGELKSMGCYKNLPVELLQLKEVTLSGDGEPTLCPNFAEVVGAVVRLRALGKYPFFKIVLVSNASGLRQPEVQAGLKLLTGRDEIWLKLDAGSQAWFDTINRSRVDLETILNNILLTGLERTIIIQSLFPLYKKVPPPPGEIDAYVEKLQWLKSHGAMITHVQIYSAHRPTMHSDCDHLPLRALSQIARHVRDRTGLSVAVY